MKIAFFALMFIFATAGFGQRFICDVGESGHFMAERAEELIQVQYLGALLRGTFISGTEQEARLITSNDQRVLHSEFCPDNSAQVRLRITINEQGQVVKAKEISQSSYYLGQSVNSLKLLLKQASHLVLSRWHYKPLLVGGRPISLVTFARVRCTQ